jgi:hypothetical protein
MKDQIIPSKQGQVVKILFENNPSDQYLVVDDLANIRDAELIKVCSISELQRATAEGRTPKLDLFKITELSVLADDLKSFIESFNQITTV